MVSTCYIIFAYLELFALATGVTKVVKAFIQVMGLQKMPLFPHDIEDARAWYQKVSLYYAPERLLSMKQFSVLL